MSNLRILFVCAFLLNTFIWSIAASSLTRGNVKDSLGYPEQEDENQPSANSNNKFPLFLPSRCNVGELFYPGDQLDDWVCDCRPGHLYFPLSNRCFAAYTRGPCDLGRILVLQPNSVLPICVVNSCKNEHEVFFRNACYRLNTPGPCSLPELATVVTVNPTTLRVECIGKIPFEDRIGNNGTVPIPEPSEEIEVYHWEDKCYRGGKRSYKGECADKQRN